MNGSKIKKIIGYLGILGALLLAVSGLVMLLWNAVLPKMAQVPKLDYWHALALTALARILFGRMLPGFNKFFGRKDDYLLDEIKDEDEEKRAAFREEWQRRSEQLRAKDE